MAEGKDQGTSCGDWKIEPRVIVDDEGVTEATWISDGHNEMVTTARLSELMINEMVTTARLSELMIGLAMHLEVDHFDLEPS